MRAGCLERVEPLEIGVFVDRLNDRRFDAAAAPAMAEYGSTCEEPMARMALVPQFCS